MQEYPEMLRVRSDWLEKREGKRYADAGKIKSFLKGRKRLVVEEKLDGSQMAIGWKNDEPYTQGRRSHISQFDNRPAYNGVLDWVEEHKENFEVLRGYLVFGEWLKVRHHVHYDLLSDWFIAFDVWDARARRFLPLKRKREIINNAGLNCATVLHEGKLSATFIHEIAISQSSAFSNEDMEGIVIKDYEKQDFIKFVLREFEDDDSKWTSSERQELNEIIPRSPSSSV